MNTTATGPFPPPRVAANLAHAWGGVWRLTFRRLLLPAHWLTLAIGLAVLLLLCLGGAHSGTPDRFLDWTINFYVTFVVPALAFMGAAGVMRDEMKSATVDYVLTRPVPRPAFLVFKFLAHTICAQIDFLFAFALVTGFAAAHSVPDLAVVAPKLLFGQLAMVTAFSALGFLCGTITSRYVVIGLAYGGIIEAGVGQIPTQLSRLSMTHQMRELLAVWLGRVEAQAASPGAWATAALVLAFAVVALTAAVAVFSLRELAGPADA
jgi:ABC-type transport system involved in multi-copper enzyme maturation permease subunit